MHYYCSAQLDDEVVYFLWYSGERDHLHCDRDGRIVSNSRLAELLRYAHDANLDVELAEAAFHYDLDALAAWSRSPSAGSIDCSAFLDAWNLFSDLWAPRSEVPSLVDEAGARSSDLYDKLFFGCNLTALTRPGRAYVPEFTDEDVAALGRFFELGLTDFRARLSDPRPHPLSSS